MKKIYGIGIVLTIVLGCMLLMRTSLFAAGEDDIFAETKSEKIIAPTITKEEEAEYQRLAEKNIRAKEIFNDIKVFSALFNQLTEFIPQRDVEIKGAKFDLGEVKELLKAMIGTVFNVAEMGLGVIAIVEEQAPAIRLGVKCLAYTDVELKAAAAAGGKKVDNEIMKCAPAGCKTKRGCVARTVKMSALAFQSIFDNAVGKYDIKTGNIERGLMMNVDHIINFLVKKMTTVPSIRDYLSSKKMMSAGREVTYLERTELFLKKIDTVRKIVRVSGSVISGVAGALITAAAFIDPTSITAGEMGQYEEAIRKGQSEHIDISDEKLDGLALGDF